MTLLWKTIVICGMLFVMMVATVNCRSQYVRGKSLEYHRDSYYEYKQRKACKEKKEAHNCQCKGKEVKQHGR